MGKTDESWEVTEQIIIDLQCRDRVLATKERRGRALLRNMAKKYRSEKLFLENLKNEK